MCERCGDRVAKKVNNQQYCKECAKKIKLDQTRDIARNGMRRLREKEHVKKSRIDIIRPTS